MKKFLSLVLALVMTMSLVTISAGATEYKDLTDKDEITYEEAVAVLNKLGIITGYEDGSFKPTGNLTRGAAAKIIASIMIGSDAADKLAVTAAPYKDVPVDNNFAAYISYCKTARYIDGYADGTFRPSEALTGYAFAKMLMGALGYRGDVEGFTGTGWTMNVARLANSAGLLKDIVEFGGTTAITREVACQLALNTLKATEVEYTANGNNIVVGDKGNITGTTTNYVRSYITSNNSNFNHNINAGKTEDNFFTLELGEEKFPQLVLDNVKYNRDVVDAYGRPSNKWSLKNVEIGTYPKTADFTFTARASGDTDVDKVKDMGLKDFKVANAFASSSTVTIDTVLTVNGKTFAHGATGGLTVASGATAATTTTANAKTLADYVQNGSKVEIYLSEDNANIISHIAVTQTQIMQVNRVTSDDVTLKTVEKQGIKTDGTAVAVNAVQDDDACYNALKDLKADDFVVVTPLATTTAGTSYDVGAVYAPTTATGNITKVKVNAAGDNTSAVTVGGTDYDMSRNWTAEDADGNRFSVLNGTSVTTKQESTVYIDSFGYAIYVSNVKATTNHFLFDETYSNIIDGRIHYFAQGWDTKGNEVSLDLGTQSQSLTAGNVYGYELASNNSSGDYRAFTDNAKVKSGTVPVGGWDASATNISDGNGTYYFASSVKFIFPTWENGEITGVTVKDGAQKISAGVDYDYVLNNDSTPLITAVFLSNDKDVEVSQNVLYVQKQTYSTDVNGKRVSVFTGYINGEKMTDLTANKLVDDNTFYTYSVNESSGVYTLNEYTSQSAKATSVVTSAWLSRGDLVSNAYVNTGKLYLSGSYNAATNTLSVGDGTLGTNLNLNGAKVIDLRTGGTLASARDMADYRATVGSPDYAANLSYKVSLVYNDSTSSSMRGRVSYLFILDAVTAAPAAAAKFTIAAPDAKWEVSLDDATYAASVQAVAGQKVYLRLKTLATAVSVDTTIVLTAGKVDNLTEVQEGLWTFEAVGAVATGDYTTKTANSIDQIVYVSAEDKIYVDYTGTLTDAQFSQATKAYLEKAGYTDITFGAAGATGFDADTVDFKLNGYPVDRCTVSLSSVARTFVTFKVNGVETNAVTGTLISAATGATGTYVKNGADYVAVTTTVVAGADYTGDYVKVTMPASESNWKTQGLNFVATEAGTDKYVAVGGTFDITFTVNGTSTGNTTLTVTPTGATYTQADGAVIAASGTTTGMTSVATGSSKTVLTFTPAGSNAVCTDAIYTVNLTVTTSNVTFANS